MDNIFNKIFYFTQNLENGIVLFDRIEEFEIFQMRMGLENLCQNTLVYPVGRHSNGQLHYEIHTSPHSKNFYNSKCLKFCKDPGNSSLCNQMMHQIATYFCESRTIESKRQISPHRIRKALANFSPGKGQKILCFADHWSVPGQ